MDPSLTNWTWPSFEKAFNMVPPKASRKTLPDLTDIEHMMKLQLPPSYRYYVQNWGSGVIFDFFVIYTPVANPNLDIRIQYPELLQRIQRHIKWGHWETPSLDILRQMCPFGKSNNGDILGWDRTTIFADGEMPIYIVDSESEGLTHIGDSLLSFFGDFCMDGKLDKVFPIGDGSKWNFPVTFESYE